MRGKNLNFINCTLFVCLVFTTACSTIKTFQPTENDIPVVVNISKASKELNHSSHNGNMGTIFIDVASDEGYADEVFVVSIFYKIIDTIIDEGKEDAGVYAYPDGYRDTHMQKLHWGYNKVYIPKQIAQSGGKLVYETHGKRSGIWTSKIEPIKKVSMQHTNK